MTRSPVVTRAATDADLPVLLGLLEELRHVGGRAERAVNPFSVGHLADRLREVLSDDSHRVVLACIDDAPAGMAVLRVARPDPLATGRLVQVSHVFVSRAMRRRGVGQALVDAATEFALERQVDHVAVGVYPSLRDVSRFYARLGFAPAVLYRIAPVAVLRRRRTKERQPDPYGDVLRRRTRLLRSTPPRRVRRPLERDSAD